MRSDPLQAGPTGTAPILEVPAGPPVWTGPLNMALGLGALVWLVAGIGLLARDPAWAVAVLPASTLALTCLFILAHEAIHRRFWPGRPWLDTAAGTLFALAFVFMDYRRLRSGHRRHHQAPGTGGDPDFHPAGRFWRHLGRFVLAYLGAPQLVALAAVNTLAGPEGLVPALVLGWYLPAVLSTLLLFTLGVFLVHHPGLGGRLCPEHRAAGLRLPLPVGLLSVMFFNVHWLHHAAPQLAWFQLARHRGLERYQVGLGEAVAAARGFCRAHEEGPGPKGPGPGSGTSGA